MDDDSKEVLKALAEVAFRPATELIDNVIGVLGGDALGDFRELQRARRRQRHADLSDNTIKLLKDRGVKEPVEPNAAAVDELADAAQNEPREELRMLWTQLLAAMFDPMRAPRFRKEFIEIAKQLEPLDAAVLPFLVDTARLDPSRLINVSSRTGADVDAVQNSFRNLRRLELTFEMSGGAPQVYPYVTALGRQFLACVR